MKNVSTIVEEIKVAVRECGQVMLQADRSTIAIKDKEGKANFVTEYDSKVQRALQEKLTRILPEAGFLGEEDNQRTALDATYIFVVDPIDGTTNFIKDYHMSCISVGLLKDKERYLGVIYNPYLQEMYWAVKGQGAYCNGKPIHVSKENLENGIVVFGTAPYNVELARKSFDLAYAYFQKSLDVRRSGSAALDLCAVAAGRAELFFECCLSPWDYAAGALLVEEAGGIVTNLENGKLPVMEKTSILARNK